MKWTLPIILEEENTILAEKMVALNKVDCEYKWIIVRVSCYRII